VFWFVPRFRFLGYTGAGTPIADQLMASVIFLPLAIATW
jgi:hypothetical protein